MIRLNNWYKWIQWIEQLEKKQIKKKVIIKIGEINGIESI